MIETYSKTPEDFDYRDDQMDVSSKLDAYMVQLMNILTGQVGAVFGAQEMPVDLESYIFELGLNEQHLRKVIMDKLRTYSTLYRDFRTEISVRYEPGKVRQIAYIDIVIEGIKGFSLFIR